MPMKNSAEVPSKRDKKAIMAPARPRRTYVRKTDIVLVAAERVFLRSGFAATSMDEVADEAGVSKRTVYSNFGSKQNLFAQVVRSRCASVPPNIKMFEEALELPPEEGLIMLGTTFLKGIYHPAQVELYQTVIAAVRHAPEVGRIMYEGPILTTQHLFEEFLAKHVAAGRLALDDVEVGAARLIAMLKTNIHVKVLLGRTKRLSSKTIIESVEASVQLFLYGALPRR